jgi:Mor family transcriptional regulator
MARVRRRWGDTQAELARRLSPAALGELIEGFGGRIIRIPNGRQLERAKRVARIHQLLDDHSYRETAKIEGVSTQTVYRASRETS